MGADTGDVVQLEIPARPEFLSLARLIVAAAASGSPLFPEDRLDDLRLAVSEVCTNAIEAQARARRDAGLVQGEPDDHIVIRCHLAEERVEIEVRDRGTGFDPSALGTHPPVTDPTRLNYERGLGIPLVRILTDEVEFDPSPDGTVVRMVLHSIAPPDPT